MTLLTQAQHAASFIISEANGHGSRHTVTLLGGFDGAGKLFPGTVLGKIAASQKYVISPATGSDDSQIADAILYGFADISGGDVEAVAIVRNAEVNGAMLIFDPSVDSEAEKRTKAVQLDAAHIVVRGQLYGRISQ